MDVFWLQQSEADVPSEDSWLCESEAVQMSGFRFAKRRCDWRLGRWTAKCAVVASLNLPDDRRSLQRIEINPASTGQPEVTVLDSPKTVTISISHRSGIAICAVAVGNVKLGCDLEIIEARSDAFIADYFTHKERERIAQASRRDRHLLVSLLWSAKESALKAMHVGLRADTRSVEVRTIDALGPWPDDAAADSEKVFAPAIGQTFPPPIGAHCNFSVLMESSTDGGDTRQTPSKPWLPLRHQASRLNCAASARSDHLSNFCQIY